MNIFNLTASLTLDKSNYEQGIETAKKQGKDFASKTEKDIGVIATNAWVQLAEKVVQVGQKIAKVTLDLINYADKYGDLSAKYDISTQSLQEFEYIASQTGATLETVLSTMTMMYNRAKEDDEVFAKLGVSITDVNGNMKTMDTLFWEVKSALDAVDNSGDRSALMLEAFGRNAMSLGEFLRKDTAELQEMAEKAHELGIILENETIESAGSFNDKLDELKLQGQSAFAELIMGAEGAEQKIEEFADNLVLAFNSILPNILKVGENIGKALIAGLWSQIRGNFVEKLLQTVGYGWAWEDEGVENFIEDVRNPKNGLTGLLFDDADVMDTNNYEVTERKSSTMEIKLTASGTTAMDEQNIKAIAQELVPIIDKQMGGIL
jgi:hypothetical protein